MAESMVEKVARAIYEADDVWSLAFPWPTMGSSDQSADNYRRIARSAIEAMREPTEAMIDAAFDYDEKYEQVRIGRPLTPEESQSGEYRAMIDAALNEEVAG